MDKVFELLKQLIPLEIAALIVVFIYFLKVFRDLSSEFVKISQQQAEYMRQRVEAVDKTTGIYERTVQHQEKDLKRLYELNDQMTKELEEQKGEAVARLDEQLNDVVKSIQEIKREKLSKEEFDQLTSEVDRAKQNTEKRYDEAIKQLSLFEEVKEPTVSNINTAFVVMPYQENKNALFNVIKTQLAEISVSAIRADEITPPNEDIASHVRSCIDHSDIIIADVSDRNPNVMYELGYAHGNGKRVLLLTTDTTAIPFDFSNYRVIFYDDSLTGIETLKVRLTEAIDELRKRIKTKEHMKEWAQFALKAIPYAGSALRLLIH